MTKATQSTEYPVNRIKSLVHYWMSIWDTNAEDATALVDLLSPEGFVLHTTTHPEPITTVAELQSWYAELHKQVKTDSHQVNSIEIEKLPTGRFRVMTNITCPGITTNNEPFLLTSVHDWEVADYGGVFPKICELRSKVTMHDVKK